METRDIHEDQWIEFFDRFSRDHFGCANRMPDEFVEALSPSPPRFSIL